MKPAIYTGGVDSSENSFAVFINSNQSQPLSTSKSHVYIPFNGNIADADPHKTVQISLTSMHFTNTIFNITDENNTLEYIVYYAEGRGKDASYEIKQIRVPEGFYNITQMSDYLSQSGIMGFEIPQFLFQYTNGSTYCNLFTGFGAIPLDPNDNIITKAAPTNNSNTKIIFQSPDLGHLIQFGTDMLSPTSNLIKHSYIYAGIYILYNTRTIPLLKMLGYFNINVIPPDVIEPDIHFAQLENRPPYRGYGIRMQGFCSKNQSTTQPEENTTFYSVTQDGIDLTILTPDESSTQFSGIIYESPPGYYLSCLFEANPNDPSKYIQLEPGEFISGTGITVPGPYVTSQIYVTFQGTLTNGQNILTGVTTTSVIMDGLVIANLDPFTTPSVGLLPNPDYVYSQLTPLNYYYITGPGPDPDSYMLNQNFNGTTVLNGYFMGLMYVITQSQVPTPGGVPVNMLATIKQITDVAGYISPSNVTNMAGIDEIHIHCEQLRTRNVSSIGQQALCASDVIAVVPVEVEFGFKQNYQPPNPLISFLQNTNIVNLEMRLTDQNNRDLDFNGVDWSLTLFCQEITKQSDELLASSGTMNTPFQDQLISLEGTAWAQERAMRKNSEYTFYQKPRKSARRL